MFCQELRVQFWALNLNLSFQLTFIFIKMEPLRQLIYFWVQERKVSLREGNLVIHKIKLLKIILNQRFWLLWSVSHHASLSLSPSSNSKFLHDFQIWLSAVKRKDQFFLSVLFLSLPMQFSFNEILYRFQSWNWLILSSHKTINSCFKSESQGLTFL